MKGEDLTPISFDPNSKSLTSVSLDSHYYHEPKSKNLSHHQVGSGLGKELFKLLYKVFFNHREPWPFKLRII